MDAVDELIEHRKRHGISKKLERVYRFHQTNPQVLDFLVQELRDVRDNGWSKTSLGSLWHHARWVLTQKYRAPGETFVMSNNLFPHYERIIVILHPDLNGFYEMLKAEADADFGTMLEPASKDNPKGYVRRLVWADGKTIENGWRPSTPHVPQPVARRPPVRRKPPVSHTAAQVQPPIGLDRRKGERRGRGQR